MTGSDLHTIEGKGHVASFIFDRGDEYYGGLVIQPPVSFSEDTVGAIEDDTGMVLEERVSSQFGTYYGFEFAEREFSHIEPAKVRERILEVSTEAVQTLVRYADFTHEDGIGLMAHYHGADLKEES